MSTQPAISIITPVWNGMPYIIECIESVLNQEFTDWELIIGDNGSTDGTIDYLNTLNDERIKIFKHKVNKGIFGNLNFLFNHTNAPISQILCADDYFINKNSLGIIVNYWQNLPDVSFARFNHKEPTNSKNVLLQQQVCPEVITPDDAALWFYIFGNIPGNLSNVSLKNSLFENVGMFREDLPYAGDFEFWTRAALTVKMGVKNDMLIYVRRHEGVASNYLNKKGELIAQRHEVMQSVYNILIKKYPGYKRLLKSMGTLSCDTQVRSTAIRAWLKENKSHLQELNKVNKIATYVYGSLLRWVYFALYITGCISVDRLSKTIIKKLLSSSY